jgi:hypothetical protein
MDEVDGISAFGVRNFHSNDVCQTPQGSREYEKEDFVIYSVQLRLKSTT